MQFTITKVLVVLAISTMVFATSIPSIRREPGTIQNLKPVTFRGEIGGHAFEESGTVQEVWAKLKSRHPEIEMKKRDVESRAMLNKVQPPICIPVDGQDWNYAEATAIEDGVNYLIHLDTRINMAATSCGRISCSWNSAIYLCNDNDYEISPASPYLASYAQDILNECYLRVDGWTVTGGQEFDTDNYNIIVRSDSC